MKKLVYKGKYNGKPESLPHGEHKPGAVKFKEFEDPKRFGIFINVIAIIIMALLLVFYFLREEVEFNFMGCVCSFLAAFPHEFLHAICFREEAYLYTNWKSGMLFVVGPESMSKARFIFLSMLPNVVFGFLPYILYMIYPNLTLLGTMGAFSIGMGAGDYYNVWNALTQMPKGARTYLYGFNSYWYMPEDNSNKGGKYEENM